MNVPESKAANVLGGKTARACDNCLLKRARWFCAADDAFLCQACDTAVHTVNQLASRHHRVRLQTASFKGGSGGLDYSCSPAWHQGFTRKARTRRRPAKLAQPDQQFNNPIPVVPEINSEDLMLEEKEEQLLHRVPDFDDNFVNEFVYGGIVDEDQAIDDHDLNLAELLNACDRFVEDVGGLFGEGSEEDKSEKALDGKRVKVEEEEEEDDDDGEVREVIASHFDPKLDMELNWEFDDYACSIAGEEGDEAKMVGAIENTLNMNEEGRSQVKKRMLLRLNYEEVIDAWANQRSPWENGVRPHFELDDFMAEFTGGDSHMHEGVKRQDQVERKARVLRYKEKRRTRLFSKKIRYEVRKLNAEKRPRIKGRFVKRTNFSGSSLPYTMHK